MKDLRRAFGLLGLFLLAALVWGVSPAAAQLGDPPLGLDLGLGGNEESPVSLAAQFTAPAGGKPGRLFITARMKPTWHIFSITQAAGGPMPTKVKPTPAPQYKLTGPFVASSVPKKKTEPDIYKDVVIEEHYGEVTWYAPLELAPGVDPATLVIQGKVNLQACDPKSCVPTELDFTARLGKGVAVPEPAPGDAKTPPSAKSGKEPAAPKPDAASSEADKPAAAFDAEVVRQRIADENSQKSLLWNIALGFFGGMLLNLMPCVLPVIGLKVMSFVDQAGRDRAAALLLNVWYSLGMLVVFWVLAGLAIGSQLGWQVVGNYEGGWGSLYQHAGFNIFLAGLVFAMALSFLGVWEIPIPGFVGTGSVQSLTTQEGFSGAFSKGIVTTLLATPCTGPFMGSAIGWALGQPPTHIFAVFTAVGLGMASPYLLVGAFPKLLAFLPKPGAWMETFKQLLGFVLLGTVVYLLYVLPFQYVVPTAGLLFALWAAFWWIGRTPATAEFGQKFWAWLEAAAFVGAVWIFLFPGLRPILPESWSDRPWATEGLVAAMQSRLERSVGREAESVAGVATELPWKPFVSRQSFQKTLAEGNTVLIDFTADWCPNCKTLEKLYLNTRSVREKVNRFGVVPLKADWTQPDPEIKSMLEILGAKQVPVVAVFSWRHPNEPIRFLDGYTQDMLLDALEAAGPSKGSPAAGLAGP